jgi:diamine N-acetyltransferase
MLLLVFEKLQKRQLFQYVNYWVRAIYVDDTPIGFLMLYDSPEESVYFIWRFMIAGPFQAFGYGKKAIGLLIEFVKKRPGARELLVSCEEGEGSPENFYTKLGFKRTGKMQDEEVILGLTLE